MKRIILKMGVLGVFCLVAGCSDDGSASPLQPVADNDTEVSSSNEAVANSSSSSAKPSESTTPSSESGSKTPADPTVIHEQVVITDSGAIQNVTYPSSAVVFCWTEGCEAKYASSSSTAPKSSEDKIVFTESSASVEPPTVNGNTMTDNRDGQTYKVQNVGGKLWMAQDLNFKTGNSMCFGDDDANCAKYGRLYAFVAAARACPPGWKLPERNEAQAVLNDDAYPWSYSGRCKEGNCDFTEKMGFHWTNATPQEGDKNYGEKNGEIGVIIVEKEPEYAGSDDQKFFQVDEKSKFFSVRCVQE